MGDFQWNSSRTRRASGSLPTQPLDPMELLRRSNQDDIALNLLLSRRGQHQSMLESQHPGFNFSTRPNIGVTSALTVETEDIIRQRLLNEVSQFPQPRIPTLRLGHDNRRVSTISAIADSRALNSSRLTNLAQTIPGYPALPRTSTFRIGQHSHLLESSSSGLIDLMGRSSTIQDDSMRRALDSQAISSRNPTSSLSTLLAHDSRHSNFQGSNPIMHLSSNLRFPKCRKCGRQSFSNHMEVLEHEILCNGSCRLIEPNRLLHQSNNDSPSKKLPPSSLPLPMGSCTNNVGDDSHETTSSIQLTKPLPLAMPTDKYSITPLHCFVRRYCVELFTASSTDIFHRASKGKRRPIHVGRVGIRCPHCHKAGKNGTSEASTNNAGLNKGSVYFPSAIASIYNATMNLLQRHMHVCENISPEIIERYNELKLDDARSGTSKKYWIESAKALGLVDTPHGIEFSSSAPLSIHNFIHSDDAFSCDSNALPRVDSPACSLLPQKANSSPSRVSDESSVFHDIEGGPLVSPEYKYLATAYSYALLSQMQACAFTDADCLGKRKGLPLGFSGLACRHCYDEYGSGRFFPSNIKTMSDTSKTLNVLHNHMMRCRKCPPRVRLGLETLRLGHDEERSKMKFGSQKAFFVTIWKKLHGTMPLDGRRAARQKKETFSAALKDGGGSRNSLNEDSRKVSACAEKEAFLTVGGEIKKIAGGKGGNEEFLRVTPSKKC